MDLLTTRPAAYSATREVGVARGAKVKTRVIGLTGGIASGKSTVARILRELGAPVVDADVLARQVVEPGQPAYEDIVREFGTGVLAADGTLDRKKLGERVFGDPAARARLNAITHPRIGAAGQAEIARHVAAGAPVVFYEAALIVENGMHRLLDGLVVVSASPEAQLVRTMQRDGLDDSAARARLAAQLPLADKLAAATHVIDNSGTPDDTRAQVVALWTELTTATPAKKEA
jgi:dephospho-CoA kinase